MFFMFRFTAFRCPVQETASFPPHVDKQKIAAVFNCGDFQYGGPERDRTVDLSDANKPLKLFSIISGHFWPFPLRSTSSLGLFDHAVSVWSEAVCGGFCGQQRSPALAGVFHRQGRGAFFMPLGCLDCTSVDRIRQVISVPLTPQELRDCKQKVRNSRNSKRYDKNVEF